MPGPLHPVWDERWVSMSGVARFLQARYPHSLVVGLQMAALCLFSISGSGDVLDDHTAECLLLGVVG